MPKLRNINPYGSVDVPLLRREGEPYGEPGVGCLVAGEEFDCTAEQASVLLAQADNYEPVDDEAKAIAAELASDAADAEDEAAGVTEPVDDEPPADELVVLTKPGRNQKGGVQ